MAAPAGIRPIAPTPIARDGPVARPEAQVLNGATARAPCQAVHSETRSRGVVAEAAPIVAALPRPRHAAASEATAAPNAHQATRVGAAKTATTTVSYPTQAAAQAPSLATCRLATQAAVPTRPTRGSDSEPTALISPASTKRSPRYPRHIRPSSEPTLGHICRREYARVLSSVSKRIPI